MKSKQIVEIMLQNFAILQQIHKYVHQINIIQTKCTRVHRDRWSQEEDAILFDAVNIFGNRDCGVIAALIVSKSASQVYQRLRYLRGTLVNFIPCNQSE
ncbi:SANT/Myb_domain [Hexamita inflata]|uniref:SANT/Myb domain n=1 Tax=Hexamita inflata TaxID=28002 RepID=A0AA86Q770_9EUKA|nr:SANT/Myb domain [Hexamita inflata]